MDYYGGCRTFTWLADVIGLRLDLVNFIICQLTSLFFASLFRSVLHPTKVSSNVRHAVALTFGLCCGYFCFGQQVIHVATLPAICYIIIRIINPRNVHRYVLIVAMTYLLSVHLVRLLYDREPEALDITAPLMIITQKVTSLAFSIHDGFARPRQELTKAQQHHAVRKMPLTLEYFSYVLHFHGLLAGPVVFYRDYIDFIEGAILLKYSGRNTSTSRTLVIEEPSPIETVVKKVFGSVMCALIFIKFSKLYPVKIMKEEYFIKNTCLIYKLWYAMMSTTVVRFKYYHAWLLADAICNNSGLGFSGYDKNGKANWDLISNINIFGFEFATNMRDAINHWNCGTNRWLRNIVYERVQKKYGTILTFALSAVWHGFYPGYYLTFATGALMITSARSARRLFRYRFQRTQFGRMLYDILTCCSTRIVMGYTTFPFVILEFMSNVKLYMKLYLCLHFLALSIIYILPKCLKSDNTVSANTCLAKQSTEAKATPIERNEKDNIIMLTTPISASDSPNKLRKRIALEKSFHINSHYKIHKKQNLLGLLLEKHQHPAKTRKCNSFSYQQHRPKQKEQTIQQLKQMATHGIFRIKHDHCEIEKLSSKLLEELEEETRQIGGFIDTTVREPVNGLVKFESDLMPNCSFKTNIVAVGGGAVNKKIPTAALLLPMSPSLVNSQEKSHFIKKEIDVFNTVVQQGNVVPVVLSNGQAK